MNLGYGTFEANVGFRAVTPRAERLMPKLQGNGSTECMERIEPETAKRVSMEWILASNRLPLLHSGWTRVSPWSRSGAKRAFDCICVLLVLPLLIPIMLIIGLAVRLTSRGPILFTQRRMGRNGRAFTILKFRTMTHVPDRKHHAVTTAVNQRFTPIGPFLRTWKLDELPQLLNVLAGQMSLVGPRPKLPEHLVADVPCRPGITGAATVAFAREEAALARVPQHQVNDYYHVLVLPAKRHLDGAYMAQATFLSDLKLITKTVLRRWDDSILEELLAPENFRRHAATRQLHVHPASIHFADLSARPGGVASAAAESVSPP